MKENRFNRRANYILIKSGEKMTRRPIEEVCRARGMRREGFRAWGGCDGRM